jgi:Cu(I)/Ag(I) efflux system membrane fusion protein
MKDDLGSAAPLDAMPVGPSRRGYGVLIVIAAVCVVGAFLIGYSVAPRHEAGTTTAPADASERAIRFWTCSMHPQIRQPGPGKCPICYMDLVPVYATSSAGEGGEEPPPEALVLSAAARRLAEVQTSPVEFRPLAVTVRMVGKIAYDETRLARVAAWIPGRIDKTYVDYVGMRVRKGEHMIYLYSPDLVTAQQEYLIAWRRFKSAETAGDADDLRAARELTDSVRKKLELWGILPEQIDRLEKTEKPEDHMTIYAPMGGTIIEREAFDGKYFQTGERLFSIADLTGVWAVLDAYELDVGWLRYGQEVVFDTDVYPGEAFKGRIAFIQPVLDEMTRTVKVRVNVPNSDERLKPGMFVRAAVAVALADDGRPKAPDLEGKWMCPMHPEIVRNGPDHCPLCGMDLVPATTLGFARPEAPAKRVLSIPATAPLLTGKRAVVYVEMKHAGGETMYLGREVTLGPRAGDYYVVLAGLTEGERVVTRGAFKIDAAAQIEAKPSMMAPAGLPTSAPAGPAATAPATKAVSPAADDPAARAAFRPVLLADLRLAAALADDKAPEAAKALDDLRAALDQAKSTALSGDGHERFHSSRDQVRRAVPNQTPKDADGLRQALVAIDVPLVAHLRAFGHDLDRSVFLAFCPMAFDNRGAAWLQDQRDIRNPFFPVSMPKCGEVREEFKPVAGERP